MSLTSSSAGQRQVALHRRAEQARIGRRVGGQDPDRVRAAERGVGEERQAQVVAHPLGYVLAHQVAHAEAVATFAGEGDKPATYYASIVTWPGSGVKTLADTNGHSFAYADPASTSGHLFPAYGLKSVGIDPDHGVVAIYAGSHTASFEALRHHKVEAGEINSSEIGSAQTAGIWDPKDYVTLWTSAPIPQDPIAVRGNLPPAYKARLTAILQTLDLSGIPAAVSEPNVNSKMISAAITPTPVAGPMLNPSACSIT